MPENVPEMSPGNVAETCWKCFVARVTKTAAKSESWEPPTVDGKNLARSDPYENIGFRGMGVTKPYKFIWFRDTHATEPYFFIGIGVCNIVSAACRT